MTERIVIVGCGGFGREIHTLIDAINDAAPGLELVGYLDDGPSDQNVSRVRARGLDVLGPLEALTGLDAQVVIGVGQTAARRSIEAAVLRLGGTFATLVHPSATMGQDVEIGAGSVVCAGVRLTTNTTLGRQVHIDQNATVGHDCTIGDFARLNPQACVSGEVRIGAGVLVGAGSVILQGLRIGDDATVGAGAVVVRDVSEGTTVKGVPAR